MSIIQIGALGILCVIAIILLRDSGAPHPESIVLLFAVAVLFRVFDVVAQIITFILQISDGTEASGYVKVLIKAAGIAYIVDFASGLCRDAGEGSVASYVELAGKCEIVLLSLPVAGELIEISLGMLNL